MDAEEVLRSRFGLTEFRAWQREAIDAVLGERGKVLVVAPTGGGKSLTYQLPATMLEGTTLVLSPLVALMEDQVRALHARGIPATYLASTLDPEERYERERGLLRGKYKLVYCAPERLASSAFVNTLGKANLSLVAIDEAHCIAQWGHDFRPDYLRIGELLMKLEPKRVLACTATATPSVRDEIKKHLRLEGCDEVLRGFARPNLHLAARHIDGIKDARKLLLEQLATIGDPRMPTGAAIVYCATRKKTEEIADLLKQRGFDAAFYHAGMSGDARSKVASRFAARKLSVVCATNAFGMGIDRPDIRAVVHVQPPSSIEAYYQEVGRAGRDGEEAHGLLLCSGVDIALRRRLVSTDGNGEAADPDAIARGWALFRDLLRYLDARTCRHDFVLRYFGDEHELLGGCGHCDVCATIDDTPLDPDSESEASLVVRKALSGVARAQRRGGLLAIAEMLRGAETEKTKKFGFTSLSTFGLLKDRTQDWIASVLRSLLAAGWIDLTTNEHPVPFLTRSGVAVMKGEHPARFALPREETRSSAPRAKRPRGERKEAPLMDASATPIFERLRAARASIAKERGVPPYVVALDRTLVEMATARPRTTSELLAVYGMGPSRVEQYGERLLSAMAQGA